MSGSFGGIYISSSGLYSSQAALNVTSSNISNANVEGYTRQQTINNDMSPNIQNNMIFGGGTTVAEVRQIRNAYLDESYREQNASLSYWQTTSSAVTNIENSLNYDGETSLFNITESFFNTWEEASKSPDDSSVRTAVIEQGSLLVDTLQQTSADLETLTYQIKQELVTSVETINDISASIDTLNEAIQTASATGNDVSLLEDQRNNLLDQLSSYSNISTISNPNGTLDVYLGSQVLVNENGPRNLQVNENNTGAVEVVWSSNGYQLDNSDGQLKSLINLLAPYEGDIPSSSTDSYGLLSAYEQTLNTFTTSLTKEVNTIYQSAYDLNGNTGTDFFVTVDSDEPIVFGNIQVNPLLNDSTYLACSSSGASGDGNSALSIADLRNSNVISGADSDYTYSDYCTKTTEWIGYVAQTASSNSEIQSAVVYQLSNERLSVMAVSLDEEMSNMIMFQQAYNANAQVMDTLDQLLEQVINSM